MMREVMDVIDKDESYVYLRTTRTQECESCAMKGGCTLLGGSNELNLKAKNTEKVDVKKGDKVVVELPEVPVVKLSFLAYGIPLIVFLSIISILYTLSFSDIFSF
ncbi:MAG: SoxR reducing system RseC family protein, partial [Thermotogota bacterium]|nr:SoxR reducing system RseC family protein [Thermotogota bacterium]